MEEEAFSDKDKINFHIESVKYKDLENLTNMIEKLKIPKRKISIFMLKLGMPKLHHYD